MKKIIMAAVIAVSAASVFAYNPPMGGEELFRLSNPEMLSGASASAAGGPSFNVIPSSITYNPALPANSEIITFDLSGTAFINCNKKDEDKSNGSAFETGVIVPTKFAAFTATTSYLSSEMFGMPLGKIWDIHVGASKDVLDWLSVGANFYYRSYKGTDIDSSYGLGADFGALARVGDFGFLKDVRIGAAVLNVGKPADFKTLGIDHKDECSKYPTIFTPRAGVAAQVFDESNWVGSFSADVCMPTFVTNCIVDLAFEVAHADKLKLNLGWQYNLREAVEGGSDGISSVAFGVSYKFGAKVGNKDSNVTPAVATQYLYSGILAISGGARVDLGQKDTSGAEIEMW
ncbi:hypothetical protein [Treponema sp.]|uniref:hypothetical protein n=1 Tax=Treponema sp. TaxID=166 RepID=UPI00298E03D4|nr:hypothetical protein [Treponema sp.]MCQ2240723.1 hypothetical protein [Treponema sp.]